MCVGNSEKNGKNLKKIVLQGVKLIWYGIGSLFQCQIKGIIPEKSSEFDKMMFAQKEIAANSVLF